MTVTKTTYNNSHKRIIEAMYNAYINVEPENITEHDFDVWTEGIEEDEPQGYIEFSAEYPNEKYETTKEQVRSIGLEKYRNDKDLIRCAKDIREWMLSDALKDSLSDEDFTYFKKTIDK